MEGDKEMNKDKRVEAGMAKQHDSGHGAQHDPMEGDKEMNKDVAKQQVSNYDQETEEFQKLLTDFEDALKSGSEMECCATKAELAMKDLIVNTKQDEQQVPPPTENEKRFAEGAEHGFNTRETWVGGKWQKMLKSNPALKAAYAEVGKSYEAQRKFRQEWASKEAQKLKTARMMTQTTIEVDEKNVEYLSLSAVWQKEGGARMDWGAAFAYVQSCISFHKKGITCRGRPFITFNDMTQRFDFAYIRKGFRSAFEQTWRRQVDFDDNDGPQTKPIKDYENKPEVQPIANGAVGDTSKHKKDDKSSKPEPKKRKAEGDKEDAAEAEARKKKKRSEWHVGQS